MLLVVEDDKDMRSLLCDELWEKAINLRGSQQRGGRVGRRYAGRARPDRHGSQNAVRRVRVYCIG